MRIYKHYQPRTENLKEYTIIATARNIDEGKVKIMEAIFANDLKTTDINFENVQEIVVDHPGIIYFECDE